MKPYILKCVYALFFLFFLTVLVTPEAKAQMKNEVYLYSKVLAGYGNMFDRFDVTTPGPHGPITANHRESFANGLTIDIALGGTLSKSKNVSKYSYFDFFLLHRQLFAQEALMSFTGGGLQARYLWAYANVVVGYAHSSVEIPNRRYENNILGYGAVDPLTYGFGVGVYKPIEPRSNIIMIWDINMLFPRAPYDDLSDFLNYTWFSTSFGIKYYFSRIR